MLHAIVRLLTIVAASWVLLPELAWPQVIHVSPVYRPVIHKDSTVLEIRIADLKTTNDKKDAKLPEDAERDDAEPKNVEALEALRKTTFALQDDQLVIARQGAGIETITVADRKIRDIISDLQVKYKDSLVITSPYPLSSTSILRSTGPTALEKGLVVKANPDEPLVGVGFGVVFALADDGQSETGGLLSDAGFQLDLTGTHQFVSPGKSTKGLLPDWITAQARLGLNANQQLNVETEGEVNAEATTGAQFGAALEQADQVALTGQIDFTFPLAAERMDLIVSLPSYGVSWTQLEDFVFPPIPVADTFVTAEAVFAETPLNAAREGLQRVLPLSEIGTNALFQFRRNGTPLFYAGGGIVYKEIPVRRVLFTQADSTSLPDANSVQGELENPMDWYWRAMFGARLAGVLDLRLDAAGPLGDREGEPLLRIILGHAFPIVRD